MEFILLLRPLYETSKLRDSIQIGMLQMESTKKRGCCANVGDVGSVGGVPFLGVWINFFGMGQIVRKASLKQVGLFIVV